MNNQTDDRTTLASHSSRADERSEADEGISLKPYIEKLWSYRRVIGAVVAGTAGLCVLGGLTLYLMTPVERTASIRVRLLFDGAAAGKYPNGTPFSAAEIISTPVLTEVYQVDDVQRFGDFHRFKDALVVLNSNPEMQLLEEQYSAKLEDTKLGAADRMRIEEEFRKKREAMVDPVYSLSIRRVERLRTMPDVLVEKVLNDTLATWAKQAEAKGAIVYNVAALSRNILQPDLLKEEDYMIAVDMLRVQADRIMKAITQVQTLPGAQTFRTGKEAISLAEISTNLQDVRQLQLDPLMSLIKSYGLAKDPRALQIYIDGRLSDLDLDKAQATAVKAAVQDALQNYIKTTRQESIPGTARGAAPADTTLMPQLTGDFLDKLMELAKPQNTNVGYLQRLSDDIVKQATALAAIDREVSYYRELSNAIKTMRPLAAASGGAQRIVEDRSARALAAIGIAIDRLMAIYEGISAQNLNPSTLLYTVTTPFGLQTARSLTVSTLEGFTAIAIVLAFLGMCVICLVYDAFRKPAARTPA